MANSRKPLDSHKLSGSYRADRHSGRGARAIGTPQQPPSLGAEGLALWRSVVEGMPQGILGKVDSSLLHALCNSWELYLANVAREGEIAQRRASKALDAFLRIADRLGITPAGRQKLDIPPPEHELPGIAQGVAPRLRITQQKEAPA